MQKGLIHVYYGDGKGKTTAAIGLGIRACGNDMKVHLVQFLKANDSCELVTLRKIGNMEVLPEKSLLDFLDNKPEKLEVVLTGHSVAPSIEDRADYISYIKAEKHPFEHGQPARKGIEF